LSASSVEEFRGRRGAVSSGDWPSNSNLKEQEDQPIPISPPLSKDKETGLMIFIEVLLADLLYLQE
jgi:hypothetical protein